MDIYELFFVKMHKLGFPSEFEGFAVNYDFKYYQAEIKINPIVEKLKKMWEFVR